MFKINVRKAFGHLADMPAERPQQTSYVLHIKFGNDPPWVVACNMLGEAYNCLDGFVVAHFDPPYVEENENYHRGMVRACIFECKDIDRDVDLSTEEWRQHIVAEVDVGELERLIFNIGQQQMNAEIAPADWERHLSAEIQKNIPYVSNDASTGVNK